MLKIKFPETEIEYIEAIETEEFCGGATRRTMTFTCPSSVMNMDDLNSMLTEENTASLILINTTTGVSNTYNGYVLKLSCGIKRVLTAPESATSPAIYQDRLVFKLGKRTYAEQRMHDLGIS